MIPLVECGEENVNYTYLSCVGNKYGDIYEAQLEWARGSKLNKNPIPEYYETIIKPMFSGAKL